MSMSISTVVERNQYGEIVISSLITGGGMLDRMREAITMRLPAPAFDLEQEIQLLSHELGPVTAEPALLTPTTSAWASWSQPVA